MEWLGVGDLASPRRHEPFISYPFTFLPEAGDNLVNNGKHFPSYKRIPRPASLKSKCRIVAQSSDDQAWLQRVWSNENLVFYVFDETLCDDGACVKFVVATTDDERLIQDAGYPEASGRRELLIPNFGRLNLSREDELLLLFRIMHTFLRIYAYMLPAYHLWDLIDHYLEPSSPLTSKKYKDDYLDWAMLRTDLLLNIPPESKSSVTDDDLAVKIHNSLCRVGTALAALQRFEEAAQLYVEIGETFPDSVPGFFLAAQAFHMIGNDDASIEFYVKHLGRIVRDDPDPDLNKPDYENVLAGIIMSFFSRYEKSMLGRGNAHNRVLLLTKEDREAMGCVALFSAAHPKLEPFAEAFGVLPGTNLSSYLKSEFRRTARAKRALIQLMRSGSIREYKSVFYGCMEAN